MSQRISARFREIGLDVTAVTDSQIVQMSAALVEEDACH